MKCESSSVALGTSHSKSGEEPVFLIPVPGGEAMTY